MEEMIARLIEQSVVSGAFILVLYHILHKQDKQLSNFAIQMEKSNILQAEISRTLSSLNARVEHLEGKDRNAD